MGYVYILRCADNTLYTGSTRYLELRLNEHKAGVGAQYTKVRRPLELVFVERFNSVQQAFYKEKQIQNWSQKKKVALINSKYNQLKEFSKKSF
ncbi:GIY-YIG nuclease family protein [Gilvibacter sp.]|uniref:GIY-YIG nuclease family protein n=1 Tax=Gilvibacter sp. TaxID=2729997 RepID=UPI0034532674|nr:GIY-YIG nuclease family protein [Gilvibacter sp.]